MCIVDNLLFHNKLFIKICSAKKIVSCLLFSCYTNKSNHIVLFTAEHVNISFLIYLWCTVSNVADVKA